MKNKKILVVVNRFPSVSETFIFSKVHGLLKKGFDVTVLVHSKINDKSFFTEIDHRVKIINTPSNALQLLKMVISNFKNSIALVTNIFKRGGFSLKSLKTFVRVLPFRTEIYDIIYFGFSGIAISYNDVINDVLGNSKFVFSCRGSSEKIKILQERHRQAIYPLIFNRADKIHCVSKDMQDTLLPYGLDENKSFINPPSINIGKFKRQNDYQLNTNETIILSTGRLNFQKGYPYAIKAIAELKAKGYSLKYHIIGGGDDLGYLMYTAKVLNVQDEVIFHNRQSSEYVNDWLNKADIFLLSSIWEGIANAALEAMSMEIPIVSTDAGGMKEAIEHLKSGYLTSRFDSTALAEGLEYYINNPELAKSIGAKGQERIVANFNLTKQIECFANVYNNL